MTRAELRRAAKARQKTATYNLNEAQIRKIKDDATTEGIRQAMALLMGISVKVLHEEFKFGFTRLQRFSDGLLREYDSFNNKEFDIKSLNQKIDDELGIRFYVQDIEMGD